MVTLIPGTERETCMFFSKTGTCRFGDRYSHIQMKESHSSVCEMLSCIFGQRKNGVEIKGFVGLFLRCLIDMKIENQRRNDEEK